MKNSFIYLASQSPRRAELLRQLGLDFEIVTAPVDENVRPAESPEHYVRRVAHDKAMAAVRTFGGSPPAPLLAADTSVVVGNRILGKPHDRGEGLAMLARLAGRSHQVLSAVALWTADGLLEALSTSEVRFRDLAPAEAEAYWDTGEPADKAGGYAIQGLGAVFITGLVGSYSGVMGLPLFETAELLRQAGLEIMMKQV
ncbi:MAG TPA: nucleoside triphosphate pyrophosphatase [Gammaproteobacteria bacterium]|nr:nucleoside triphosphate pyrophosphatase [Gammaproteobacteria bacterium]